MQGAGKPKPVRQNRHWPVLSVARGGLFATKFRILVTSLALITPFSLVSAARCWQVVRRDVPAMCCNTRVASFALMPPTAPVLLGVTVYVPPAVRLVNEYAPVEGAAPVDVLAVEEPVRPTVVFAAPVVVAAAQYSIVPEIVTAA